MGEARSHERCRAARISTNLARLSAFDLPLDRETFGGCEDAGRQVDRWQWKATTLLP
jgi:hypothetical protein